MNAALASALPRLRASAGQARRNPGAYPPSESAPARPRLRPAVLAAVVALHALALAALVSPAPRPQTPPEQMPVVVSLLEPEQPVSPPAPQPEPEPVPKPRPRAVTTPRPQIQPRPLPAPTAPSTPVAEEPVTTAPSAISEPAPASPPAAAAPPAAETSAAPPAPASPPRFDAAYLNNQKPPYPPLARRLHETGTVRLRVLVSAEGLPEKVELFVSSGSPRLDQGAQEAVGRWRFVPARQGDKAIASHVIVPIVFKLEES